MVRHALPESANPLALPGCAMCPTLQSLASEYCFLTCAVEKIEWHIPPRARHCKGLWGRGQRRGGVLGPTFQGRRRWAAHARAVG